MGIFLKLLRLSPMKNCGVVLVRKREEKKGERGRKKREEKREDKKSVLNLYFSVGTFCTLAALQFKAIELRGRGGKRKKN